MICSHKDLEINQHNILPVGDRVLVEMIKKEEKTNSGIVMAMNNKPSFKGKVLKLSNGRFNPQVGIEPITEVKVGDIVICGEFCDKPVMDAFNHQVLSDDGNPLSMLLVGDILVNLGKDK